jgi:hypothetical protein
VHHPPHPAILAMYHATPRLARFVCASQPLGRALR